MMKAMFLLLATLALAHASGVAVVNPVAPVTGFGYGLGYSGPFGYGGFGPYYGNFGRYYGGLYGGYYRGLGYGGYFPGYGLGGYFLGKR